MKYVDVHFRYNLEGIEVLSPDLQTELLLHVRDTAVNDLLENLTVVPSELEINVSNESFVEHPHQVVYARCGENGEVDITPINGKTDQTLGGSRELAIEAIKILVGGMVEQPPEDEEDV